MPRLSVLATAVLSAGLVLPASSALAQSVFLDGWAASDDQLAFATADTLETVPGVLTVQPEAYPDLISGLPAPDQLYGVEGAAGTGARIVNLHDTGALPWLAAGRTPLIAKAVVDDGGATWLAQQHIVSLPSGCSDRSAMGSCVHPQVVEGLVDLAAPSGTPVGPPPFVDMIGPGTVASTGTTDHDGTLFSFAGDASVGTDVRIRADGTIVVRGDASIGDGLGGRLRGYDAIVVEDPTAAPQVLWPDGWGPLPARAAAVRDAGATPDQPNRRILACPPSRRGYVISQFLVSGLGRNVGPALDAGLDGGRPVLVSEVIPFDCGPAPIDGASSGPGEGPHAAYACGYARPVHEIYTYDRNGNLVSSSSSVVQRHGLVTLGVPSQADAFLLARVGEANGNETFTVPLEGVPLDSPTHPDATLWLGESRIGIDTFGPKPFLQLQLTAGGSNFDLLEQQRSLSGDAIKVGRAEKAVSDCPGFDFTLEDVPDLFPDGFETGDVAAWQPANAD